MENDKIDLEKIAFEERHAKVILKDLKELEKSLGTCDKKNAKEMIRYTAEQIRNAISGSTYNVYGEVISTLERLEKKYIK